MATTEPTTPAPKSDPAVLVSVLEKGTEINGHIKGKGRRERIPLSQAETLEALGKVKILGV